MSLRNALRSYSGVVVSFLLFVDIVPFLVVFPNPAYAQAADVGAAKPVTHVATYTNNSLTWDETTAVDLRTGIAQLSLFESIYEGSVPGAVISSNGELVVAPGTSSTSRVRLRNQSKNPSSFPATLVELKDEDDLPILANLSGTGLIDCESVVLPEGIEEDRVIRSVEGSVSSWAIQDFDIGWVWNFEEIDENGSPDRRDSIDTQLGNRAAWTQADDVFVGFYLLISEEEPRDPESFGPTSSEDSARPTHQVAAASASTETAGEASSDPAETFGDLAKTDDQYGMVFDGVLGLALAASLGAVLSIGRHRSQFLGPTSRVGVDQ